MTRMLGRALGFFVLTNVVAGCGNDSDSSLAALDPAAATTPPPPEESPSPGSRDTSNDQTVPPPPGEAAFDITAPDDVLVRAGGSTTFQVTLTPSTPSPALADVVIDVAGLPSGVTAQIAGTSVSLTAAEDASLGDHDVIVRATTGNVRREAARAIIVAGKPGTVDTTFGVNGIATGAKESAMGFAVDRKGRALTVGYLSTKGSFLMRHLPDGSPDTSLGGTGLLAFNPPGFSDSSASAVAALADGTVLVAGVGVTAAKTAMACLTKFDADGALVPSFGTYGAACLVGVDQRFSAVRVLQDGSLVVAGWNGDRVGVAKFTHEGKLDETFGTMGVARVGVAGETFNGLEVDSAGRLLVLDTQPGANSSVVWRLAPNGQPDILFNASKTPGRAAVQVGNVGALMLGMAVGPSDAIYLAGRTSNYATAFAALDVTGAPLTSFGSGGWLAYDLYEQTEFVAGIAIVGDRVAAIGRGSDATTTQMMSVRVGVDGQLDTSWAGQGFTRYETTILEWVGGVVPYRGRLVTMISANSSVPFSVVRIWN